MFVEYECTPHTTSEVSGRHGFHSIVLSAPHELISDCELGQSIRVSTLRTSHILLECSVITAITSTMA